MKKLNLLLGLFLFVMFFTSTLIASEKEDPTENSIQMNEEVQAVIKHSCFGCHNTDSRNKDAKEDLDFKTLHELSKAQQLGALKDIRKVLRKNEMPPKKFLEHKPEAALTIEQQDILVDWVKGQSKALLAK